MLTYRERLGATIAEVRAIRGLSQHELAHRVARSPASLSRWEMGHTMPSAWDIASLARALHVQPELLLYPPDPVPTAVEIRLRKQNERPSR